MKHILADIRQFLSKDRGVTSGGEGSVVETFPLHNATQCDLYVNQYDCSRAIPLISARCSFSGSFTESLRGFLGHGPWPEHLKKHASFIFFLMPTFSLFRSGCAQTERWLQNLHSSRRKKKEKRLGQVLGWYVSFKKDETAINKSERWRNEYPNEALHTFRGEWVGICYFPF